MVGKILSYEEFCEAKEVSVVEGVDYDVYDIIDRIKQYAKETGRVVLGDGKTVSKVSLKKDSSGRPAIFIE
jgi:hypothetical protein